ncbi:MAG: L-rhamnose mutarotase [Chitinophagaceae bacterium]
MKRLLAFFLISCMLLPVLTGKAADIYVTTNGADTHPGTKEQPMASVAAAMQKARELRRLHDPSIANGIHIIVSAGIYRLREPLFIRPEDAGTAASPTCIEAAPNEQPVLSGGVQISNWRKAVKNMPGLPAIAQQKIWVADVPLTGGELTVFRQLWVNDHKAIRAKSCNGDSMDRILSWNKKEGTCVIPLAKAIPLQQVKGAEMFIHQWWAIAMLRIKKIAVQGDSAVLYFQQPESRIQKEHPWPAPWMSKETGNSAFYLTNAIQFLDEPGEWWLDVANHTIYYWPMPGEDLKTSMVTAPSLETIVKMEGSADNPVSNVFFKGISFQHTGWLRPSKYGHVPHQAGMYMLDAYKLVPAGTREKPTLDNQAWVGRPAAAVEISYATQTGFENCRFEHLASTGLDYDKGVQNNFVKGNVFKDIGGTAMLAGVYADEAQEIHLTYHPKDEREVCDGMLISNNLVTDATNEDWSCVGIGAGYTKNTIIEHNEIEQVSYTGISMGWGWNAAANPMKNNRISANKIHHYGKHNYDCAGIYTLSAQPGSVISENYIDSIYKAPYAHLPSHWFYLYTDEGSSGISVKNNWTPSQKYLQNANGPGNEWINNGPQAGTSIQQQAGLQQPYQYLAKEKTSGLHSAPIAEEHNEIIELLVKENETLDIAKLKRILLQNNMDTSAVYQWKNHYTFFGKVQDIGVMQGRLQNNFPGVQVKAYYNMLYEFNRKNCENKTIASEWDHIILTANLVANPALQTEYIAAHATQFQKWPEVAAGFCYAGFQQLLVFKNGRQLMLVISIPKGESLDKLNPKTVENNPRMVQWNQRMKQYQQGIEGAAKNETWVFLRKID